MQDTNVNNLIINKLTKAQYDGITTPDPTQLYLTDDVISSADIAAALGYTPASNTLSNVSSIDSGSVVQAKITSSNTLSADLVDDTSTTHKFATAAQLTQIATNTSSITTINGKIPNAASTTNQLADKDFVNSSISSNTANFIGTFETVSALEAYSGTVTNNDYAFVVNSVVTNNGSDWTNTTALNNYDKTLLTNFDYAWVVNGTKFDLYRFDIVEQRWDLKVSNTAKADVTLNTAYNRYKATVSGSTVTWAYEYTLNNSSFTAAQWAAINSGITSGDVTLIGTALQPNDNISSLTNDSGYITSASLDGLTDTSLSSITGGQFLEYNSTSSKWENKSLTSTNVTTALGYTPYNSTNPSGYISSISLDKLDDTNIEKLESGQFLQYIEDNKEGYWINIDLDDKIITTALGYTPYNATNPNGYISSASLSGLTDTTISSATGGQVLQYDSTSSKWKNASLSIPTVDQTYDGTSSNAQSGAAIAGAGFLRNGVAGLLDNSYLSIYGSYLNSGGYGALIIGDGTSCGGEGVAIGKNATIGEYGNGVAIGNASEVAEEANVLNIGFGLDGNDDPVNYDLLDGDTGLIPDARISSNIARTSQLPSLTNYVTTNTAQEITGTKTFVGANKIVFKQSASTDKLGFTLYNTNASELGAFEYRPNTISSGALLNINMSASSSDYLGFRYWATPTATNIVAPKPSTAGDYYIPLSVSDGTNSVTANNTGVVNISTLLPDISTKQDTLVSGTNIKTINNESILGSGNITIQGGGSITVDQTYDGTSTNAQSGVAMEGELTTNYQPKLVSGTNIKSINNSSILGSGNIALADTTLSNVIQGVKWARVQSQQDSFYGWCDASSGGGEDIVVYTMLSNPSVGDSVYRIESGELDFFSTVSLYDGSNGYITTSDYLFETNQFEREESYDVIADSPKVDLYATYPSDTQYEKLNLAGVATEEEVEKKQNLLIAGENVTLLDVEVDLEGWTVAARNASLYTNNTNTSWIAGAYGNGVYSLIGYYGTAGYGSYSNDGIHWSGGASNLLSGDKGPKNIIFDGNKFVVIGQYGDICWSSTGDWTDSSTSNIYAGSDTGLDEVSNWVAIAYGGSKYVVLSATGYVATSTDLEDWTTPTQVSELGSNSWKALTYGNGKFVALGTGGYISTSEDGETWDTAAQKQYLDSSETWVDVEYIGDFVFLSSNGRIEATADLANAWSDNGVYISDGSLSLTTWSALVSGGGKCMAISQGSYISNTTTSRTIISAKGGSVPAVAYGTSSSAANATQKVVSIPEITELNVGQVIIVRPSITSTVADSTIKLNNFTAYPMRYNNAAITTSTDSVVWNAGFVSQFVFDGTYWQFLGHGLDSNTTYTLNYSPDAGLYKLGTGSYVVTRYSLMMQKADMTWEKITDPNAKYSTATTKTVNTHGFRLGQLKYYYSTSNFATGATIATNTVYDKAASVDLRYSTNCGDTPGWVDGDYIYLVGTMGVDGLFYLDSTTWWTNTLPSTNNGKLYMRIGLFTSGTSCSLLTKHPVFYHNGTRICEYLYSDNKQDTLVSGTNIKTINNESLLGSGNITADNVLPTQTNNSGKYLTTNGTTASWATVSVPTVDQTYSGTSTNAQSGVAVASAISTKVSKSGDTMTGGLAVNLGSTSGAGITVSDSLADAGSIILKNTADETTTAPSAEQMRSFRVTNSDDTILGDVRFVHSTSGDVNTAITSRSYASGNAVTATLQVGVASNGTDKFCSVNAPVTITGSGAQETIKSVIDYSTRTAAGDTYSDLRFADYTGTRRNTIRSLYGFDAMGTLTSSTLILGTNTLSDAAPGGLKISHNGTSGSITIDSGYRPSATAGTASMAVATCGWVNDPSMSTNVVHRSDSETIGGDKSFTGSIIKTVGGSSKGTAASSNTYNSIQWYDADSNHTTWQSKRLGIIEHQFLTDGSSNLLLQAYRNYADSTAGASISLKVASDGTTNVQCTAPATSSNTNDIATTAWVRTKINGAISYNSSTRTLTLGL